MGVDSARVRTALRAATAGLFVFAAFMTVCYLLSGPRYLSSNTLVIRTPEDLYNGVGVSLAALVASAMGVLICGRQSSRPMAFALAVGIISLNLDPSALWDQLGLLVWQPGPAELAALHKLPGFHPENWAPAPIDLVRRAKLYWTYYTAYILWTMVILYSGYIGQYLMGLWRFRGRKERKESALYVAENAGLGLAASAAAGLLATLVAVGMAALLFAAGPATPVRLPGHAGSSRGPAKSAVAAPAPKAASERTPVAGPASKLAPPAPASRPALGEAPPAAGVNVWGKTPDMTPLQRVRVYALLVAIAFAVAAYLAALGARPRTSTWLACGAIIGVLALPLWAAKRAIDPEHLGAPFQLLELSPFVLAGTAVASALAGDWAAKMLMRRKAPEREAGILRPL